MLLGHRTDAEAYAAHAGELVRFAAGLVGGPDAPDVVADAFVRVRESQAWREARDRRALWYRAVMFEAQHWQRSMQRRLARDDRYSRRSGFAAVPEPPDPAVAAAVERLSPQQRAVVHLTYWDDLDAGAIADLLGISEGSVRKHLARAREQLRRVLG